MIVWKAWLAIGAATMWLATITDGMSLPSPSPLPLPTPSTSMSLSKNVIKQQPLGIAGTIQFTITYETRRSDYMNFIEQVRAALGPPDQVHGVPRLRQPNLAVTDPNRYLHIEVRSYDGRLVTFAIDIFNVYVVGFRVEQYSYFFRANDGPNPTPYPAAAIFPGTRSTTLAFSGNYNDLDPQPSDQTPYRRENLPLGMIELSAAVDFLYHEGRTGRVVVHQSLIPSLLVVIQMISESARYNEIARLSQESIEEENGEVVHWAGTAPSIYFISLENQWSALSDALQRDPTDPRTVGLQQQDYSTVPVSVMDDILRAGIALVLYVNCARYNNKNINHNTTIIRMVADDALHKDSTIGSGMDDSGSTCDDTLTPMLVRGYNGMCLEVKDGKYQPGNSVVMSSCANKVSQNWTFNSNDSITSNGMCLTVMTSGSLDYVGIYTCDPKYDYAWHLLDDGSIYSLTDKQVMTVYKSGSDYSIRLAPQTNYLTAQGWTMGLSSTPLYWNVSIVGMNDLCLQTDGSVLWLAACTATVLGQQWLIYPDGSVRPNINFPNNCLTSSLQKGQPISVTSCSETKQGQRWNFADDGTIQDLAGGFVMNVYNNDITQHIITWPVDGGANEKWAAKFAS